MDEGCGNPYHLPYPRYAPKISTTDRTHARTGPETQRAAINGNPFARFRARTPAGREADTGALGDLAHVSKMATTYERLLSAGVLTRLCRVSIGCTRGSSWHVELVCHPI